MRVIAVTNIKGGVGKTTTAVNLAFESARAGKRTLLWDLDSQAAATFSLRIKPRVKKSGRALARGETALEELIQASDYDGLDVLPADISLRRLEFALGARRHATHCLRDWLAELSERYAHVVLDCAPGLNLVAENVFEAADLILTPTIPTPLSLRAVAQLVKLLHSREDRRYRVLPFFGLVDRRRSLHRETCDWVHAQDIVFLKTEIPYSSLVEQMSVRRAPIAAFAPNCAASAAFADLYRELLAHAHDPLRDGDSLPDAPNRFVREQIENWAAARR